MLKFLLSLLPLILHEVAEVIKENVKERKQRKNSNFNEKN